MKFTYYGHSTFLIEHEDTKIVTDPFISGSPVAQDIDVNSIQADFVLATHAHLDHILDVETISKNNDAMVIANYEVATHFESKGLKAHPLNQGGSKQLGNIHVKVFNAIHSSSFADGTYGGNPLAFLFRTKDKSVFFAGDTCLHMDMKLVPMFAKLDALVLPIGGNFTMDVEEAIIASDFLECNHIIGMHYNTFPPIEIDTDSAIEQFKSKNKTLTLLEIGGSTTI